MCWCVIKVCYNGILLNVNPSIVVFKQCSVYFSMEFVVMLCVRALVLIRCGFSGCHRRHRFLRTCCVSDRDLLWNCLPLQVTPLVPLHLSRYNLTVCCETQKHRTNFFRLCYSYQAQLDLWLGFDFTVYIVLLHLLLVISKLADSLSYRIFSLWLTMCATTVRTEGSTLASVVSTLNLDQTGKALDISSLDSATTQFLDYPFSHITRFMSTLADHQQR